MKQSAYVIPKFPPTISITLKSSPPNPRTYQSLNKLSLTSTPLPRYHLACLQSDSGLISEMDVVAYNPLITHLVKYLQTVFSFCPRSLIHIGRWTRQNLSYPAILG